MSEQPGTAVGAGSAAGVRIRRASVSDLDGIMSLERSVFGHEAWPEQAMRADMLSEHCYYLVAELVGTDVLVGCAGLMCPVGSGEGDIQTIAVSPMVRGRGVGRVLMADLIGEAASRGASRLFLEVRADNPIAIGLYRALGFHEIGTRAGYYQPDNVDAVTMRLEPVPGGPEVRRVGPVGAEAVQPQTWEEIRKQDGAC